MKNIKNLLIIGIASLLVMTGCSEDFIDRAPISQQNSNNFYRNAEDMKSALTAVYGALQYGGQYYSSMHVIGDMRSDNTEITNPNAGADLQAVDNFTNVAVNSISANTWNAHYQGIQSANIVIEKIQGVSMDQTLKARYIGEAKFLRALMYFNLVRIFGDVPLVTTMINNPQQGYEYGRESVNNVYNQIISDLTDAEEALPYTYGTADIGRATKGAAMALLGKVHLTMKNFPAAAQKLKELIDASGQTNYRLLPQYASVFGPTNQNNAESIFEVQFKSSSSGEGSPFRNQFAPIGSGNAVVSVGNPLGQNIPTADMNNAYEPNDLRKDVSMRTSYVLNGNTVNHNYVVKYSGMPVANLDSDNNWIVLRYADVLLMYAEALNEQGYVADGPAFEYLNQIRTRAGLPSKTSNNADPNLSVPNQAAFRLAIEQERRVELAFEGHRWFDLIRTDRALALMADKGMQAHMSIFPIPQSQIDINPTRISQNPNY
ncbi:RagB/SusD family nutrient uptake outer membrane protein [Belliella kenyensis]|uniref:RagB/SusD family nutrient uptake outer membrane protein n=1 Tax=Belliella kenyensis TaxID=1472724 RepID=A0ABV8ELE4_9BACT|nr:RagB/SusD family nutrient uptake outer membrane protein [Belliella kenyensis]MCH7400713.1 RagB/SusD family nutrient uptake outer membrane protein [Belliella kenyensis]MDN3602000.1 RagB/SusD family nutrient uptake outer membrane protein [Belliella kenyensis]